MSVSGDSPDRVPGERWIPLACAALIGALGLAAGSAAWDAAHRGDLERVERRSAIGDMVFAVADGEGGVKVDVGGAVWVGRVADTVDVLDVDVDRTELVDSGGVRVYSREVRDDRGRRVEKLARLAPGRFVVLRRSD